MTQRTYADAMKDACECIADGGDLPWALDLVCELHNRLREAHSTATLAAAVIDLALLDLSRASAKQALQEVAEALREGSWEKAAKVLEAAP